MGRPIRLVRHYTHDSVNSMWFDGANEATIHILTCTVTVWLNTGVSQKVITMTTNFSNVYWVTKFFSALLYFQCLGLAAVKEVAISVLVP